ncbi:MAG: SAM-dependent methyltransferase [Promethearchaeota archaeon]
MVDGTEITREYYDSAWSKKRIYGSQYGEIKIPAGFHWGFFERGIKTYHEASLNMNMYIGKHLNLDQENEMQILDAGCGMGTVCLHLAKIFPNVTFTGLSLAQNEILLARKFSKRLGLENVKFLKKDYLDTELPNNYFDGIFALESLSYAKNKMEFVNEAYRLLKPGGKLMVVDGFRKYINPDSFIYKIYNYHYRKNRGHSDITIKEKFMNQLKSKGFQNIISRDISRNISKNFYIYFVNSAPRIFNSLMRETKKKMNIGDKRQGYDYPLVFFDCIFGLLKICNYEVIVAEKLESISINNTVEKKVKK